MSYENEKAYCGRANHVPSFLRCPHSNAWVFADIIKIRMLRWADYPELPRRAHCKHKSPEKEAGASRQRKLQ